MSLIKSPHLIWISGPPAAGKSTLAAALVERFAKGLIIPVDDIREWVKAGWAGPIPWTDETERQYRLGEEAACGAALHYFRAGFTAIIDGCRSPKRLNQLFDECLPSIFITKVILLPGLEENLRRAHTRTGKEFEPDFLDGVIEYTQNSYRLDLPVDWHAIDNSLLSLQQETDIIASLLSNRTF